MEKSQVSLATIALDRYLCNEPPIQEDLNRLRPQIRSKWR